MANAFHHSLSSVKKWGGEVDDYLPIHRFMDQSKRHCADGRHRILYHHTEGIFLLEQIFGPTITLSTGKELPTRFVGEQHCMEDFGFIPSVEDWLKHVPLEGWMFMRAAKLSRTLDHEGATR